MNSESISAVASRPRGESVVAAPKRLARRRLAGARRWLLAAVVWLAGPETRSADLTPAEFQAAFVSKVIPYVTWPNRTFASAEAPLVVGLFGSDPFNGLLHKLLASQQADGRRIEVKVFDDTSRLPACQVLFVRSEKQAEWAKLAEAGIPPGMLTIAADESGDFLRKGGLFNLRNSDHKLEIDRDNVGRAGLKVSSKLLRIAKLQ